MLIKLREEVEKERRNSENFSFSHDSVSVVEIYQKNNSKKHTNELVEEWIWIQL